MSRESDSVEHQNLMANIVEAIGLKYPMTYDTYDLCDLHQQNKLPVFNVQVLKKVLSYLEVPFRSKERKADLLSRNVNARVQFNEFPRSVGSWEGCENCSSVVSQFS